MQLTNSTLNKTTTTKLHIEWNDYFNISLLVWIFENNGLLIDTGSSNLYLKKLGANSITMMYMRNMRIMQSKPNTILHNNANVSHKYELCVLHIILQHFVRVVCFVCVSVHYVATLSSLRWRHNGRDSDSPASRLFTQTFIQTQIKENIKAPRHWLLCGEFTGARWIPRTNGQ